jgi:protein-S-isoprenylcysteine O-methyltransferase Ste14
MKRILPPVFLLLCVVAMILSQLYFPIAQVVRWPIRSIALLPLVIGIGMAVLGKQQFAKEGTNLYTFNDPDKMITSGLYAYSRNPMYLGFVIAAFSVAVFAGGLVPLAIALIHCVVVDRWYISFEERRMAERFGDSYDDYKNHVRRWF